MHLLAADTRLAHHPPPLPCPLWFAWLVAGTQTLLWNHTLSPHYRFACHLPLSRLLLLSLKNLLLCVLTLGLYWPHAVVATTRLRLESITLSRLPGTN